MTQAPALYSELTVDENLRFFAALQGVADVDRRIEESLRTVDLLNPRLLLLDEQTVGVDPVLRRDFWAHFRGLAAKGVTILVSSHVMDEAARRDRLGLIRAGVVLAPPSSC
jgi:ABC-2 type transport system ATP-binding protein